MLGDLVKPNPGTSDEEEGGELDGREKRLRR
jgi:hypothetical protein